MCVISTYQSQLTGWVSLIPGVATVSSESVEAGAWGGGVNGGLALVPVVAAEAEAAAVAIAGGGGEEVGPGEAGGSRDFGWKRRDLHLHPRLHSLLSLLLRPVSSLHGGGELGSDRRPPEVLSTA